MNERRLRALGLTWLALLFFLAACSGEQTPTPLIGCENATRPIVFVHGLMAGGDNFAHTAMRFASNGYCPAYLRVFDWNTLSFDMQEHVAALADFVDGV